MKDAKHIIVVHPHRLVAEALEVALSGQGFIVHPALTYSQARTLVAHLKVGLEALVAYPDMPDEPHPGTLLRAVGGVHPEAALVVVSSRFQGDIGPLPQRAVLLPEPFDREALIEAIRQASGASVPNVEESATAESGRWPQAAPGSPWADGPA